MKVGGGCARGGLAAAFALLVAPASAAAAQMTQLERDVIAEMNLARTQPGRYARYVEEWLPHFEGTLLRRPGAPAIQTIEGAAAVREAVRALRQAHPVEALRPSTGLARAARAHAEDLGPRGGLGHAGSDGSSISDRIERHGTWSGTISENISYGSTTAREVVIDLLVDDGVSGRGHRANILRSSSRFAGVGCAPHREYRIVCVTDFAGGFVERRRRG